MANQIDKIDVNKTVYDISAAPTATNTFTSGDDGAGNSWTNVVQMKSTDQNQTIFNKISTMFKNVRYLYKALGSGITPSNTATSQLANKAPSNHSHDINDIPHTNQPEYSGADKVPTMDLIYTMNQTLNSLNDANKFMYNICTWDWNQQFKGPACKDIKYEYNKETYEFTLHFTNTQALNPPRKTPQKTNYHMLELISPATPSFDFPYFNNQTSAINCEVTNGNIYITISSDAYFGIPENTENIVKWKCIF